MKKHNNHFLLIIIVSIFLSLLSSTVLVTAEAPEPPCVDEGSYCDIGGPICCPPFSCIEHICSVGCVEESGVCNIDDDCCSPATCIDYGTDGKHCCPSYRPFWDSVNDECSATEDCADDGELKSSSPGNCCDNGLSECTDGY
jgi:hypothetical protein